MNKIPVNKRHSVLLNSETRLCTIKWLSIRPEKPITWKDTDDCVYVIH